MRDDEAMQEERCPMCLKFRVFDVETRQYYRYQNSERLVCEICAREIENHLRPTWQIIGRRIFPKSSIPY